MKTLNKIKSFLLLALMFIITAGIVLVMRLAPSKQRALRRAIAKNAKFFTRYEIEIEGELDPSAQMIMLNHQSALDIVIFDEIHPKNTSWVAKKELAKIPLWGKGFEKANCILIDRQNPREIVRIIALADKCAKNDCPVMIFPEGTRGKGDKLLKFQPGAQIIANKLGFKVQPAVIIGSRKIIDTKDFCVRPGKVKIVFLPSFKADGSEWLSSVREQMQGILDKNLEF